MKRLSRILLALACLEAVRTLYPHIEADAAERCAVTTHIFLFIEITVPVVYIPAWREGLQRLEAAHIPLAVATGKSRRGLDRMLAMLGWQQRFAITRCADETASNLTRSCCSKFWLRSVRLPPMRLWWGTLNTIWLWPPP